MSLKEKVEKTIVDLGMIRAGERVGVGVSGGVDSMVLLDLLWDLRAKWDLELVVLHLDHGIRGEEAERDRRFVEAEAERRGLPFYWDRADAPSHAKEKGLSPEQAAREVRYRFFEEARCRLGLDRIALGHTADDQVETVLMALLRGSGLKGLKGIPPVRGIYIRPLIRAWRREVEEYAVQRGIRWVLDSTNLERGLLRNRIRSELLPVLETFNPRVRERILEMAEILREEDEALGLLAEERLKSLASPGPWGIRVDLKGLRGLPPGLRKRVLAMAFSSLAGRDLPYRHRLALDALIEGRREGEIGLRGGLWARREGEGLIIGPRPEPTGISERPLEVPGETYLEEVGIKIEAQILEGPPSGPFSPEMAYLDLEKVALPLTLRSPRKGDWFIPSGMKGRKKLQDFFVDHKVPRHQRPSVPVVVTGKGEICWVAGIRVDERFRATPETKKTLLLRLIRDRQ